MVKTGEPLVEQFPSERGRYFAGALPRTNRTQPGNASSKSAGKRCSATPS